MYLSHQLLVDHLRVMRNFTVSSTYYQDEKSDKVLKSLLFTLIKIM